MTAFAFTFPGGRYHATPWGKHVNEADVAWPPEPVRILRALIAVWWRKGDHAAFPKPMLDELIDALAGEAPVFHLPEAVHTHVRAYMPQGDARSKSLIFDAFLKIRPQDRLLVRWDGVALPPALEALAEHLLERIGYLGRAESWTQAGLCRDCVGDPNAKPRGQGEALLEGYNPVESMLALTPQAWTAERARQLKIASSLKGAAARRVLETLPARLCDALAIDTSVWQAAGWSPSPPVLRRLVYDRPEIGPLAPAGRARRAPRDPLSLPGRPEVARFVLAGRPRPRVEDTLRIGEVLRVALMARCPGDMIPMELLGRDAEGPLRKDPQHGHAFYLPEDADDDGWIDHLTVYSRLGFSTIARRAFERLTQLYTGRSKSTSTPDEADEDTSGRKEWRVALDQLGPPEQIRSSLLGPSRTWVSATPYLRSRHDGERVFGFEAQFDQYRNALLWEWRARAPGQPEPQIMPVKLGDILPRGVDARPDTIPAELSATHRFGMKVGDSARSTLQFARTRSRGRGGPQPDAMGASLCLTFPTEVAGPLAFGKHAHLGMGLFRVPRVEG